MFKMLTVELNAQSISDAGIMQVKCTDDCVIIT